MTKPTSSCTEISTRPVPAHVSTTDVLPRKTHKPGRPRPISHTQTPRLPVMNFLFIPLYPLFVSCVVLTGRLVNKSVTTIVLMCSNAWHSRIVHSCMMVMWARSWPNDVMYLKLLCRSLEVGSVSWITWIRTFRLIHYVCGIWIY